MTGIEQRRDGKVRLLLLLNQSRRQHYSVAVIVQLDGEDQYVPRPMRTLAGQVRRAAKSAAINVGFARIGHGANDLAPLFPELREVIEQVLAGEPRALMTDGGGKVVVDELPGSVAVQNLKHDVVAHRH